MFNIIKERYPVKINWNGSKYLGIDLEWHYDEGYVVLSMKGYVNKALREFLHRKPPKPVYGPTKYNEPEFGKKIQYAENESSKPVNEKLKKKIE